MDPDRLREEKERGMTLDLGFAWMKLPGGREVGIVDVPGHERFVKNMLAGVGGIDLAMLVIAANEGVMPQTREHLAILDLLEIKRGLVALTKKDLVDDEWLSLVTADIEELLKPTTLAQCPIIPVSAVTREGLDKLVSTIDELLNNTTPKKDIGRPRLPIDRVFTIAGSGTIVTGTLIDGSLTVGQNVEIVPAGLKSRIRGLQTHKAQLTTATPGSRVAVNLVGITTSELQRGEVLTTPGWLVPTTMLTASLRLLPHIKHPLRNNAVIGFYTGAAEAMAKVRLLEKDAVQPGESAWVQFALESPVALVNGDHYIVRSTTDTLGGGKIVDSHARRLRRFRPEVIESLKAMEKGAAEVIMALLEAKQPLELSAIQAQSDLPAAEVQPVLDALVKEGRAIRVGQQEPYLFYTKPGWERLTQKAAAVLQDYHRKFPARTGMLKVELASKLGSRTYSLAILQKLLDDGVLKEEGMVIRMPSHQVKLTPAQQAKVDAFLKALAQNPYAPPGDLTPEPDLLNLLIEQQKVVRMSESVVFSAKAYNEMTEKTIAHLKAKGKITLAEVRDMFNTSRKYAQALLEHLDEKKITRRVGDERVLWREGQL